MLILRRYRNQWVDITHEASGEVLKLQVLDVGLDHYSGSPVCKIGFHDAPRHFLISRPDGRLKTAADPEAQALEVQSRSLYED